MRGTRTQWIVWMPLLVWMGLLVRVTAHQVPIWHDNLTLWSHAHVVAPEKPRPLLNLAAAYARAGQEPAASVLWAAAIRATDRDRYPYYERTFVRAVSETNQARLARKSGHARTAILMLDRVLTAYPSLPLALYEMAYAVSDTGQCHMAQQFLDRAQALDHQLRGEVWCGASSR